MHILVGDGEGRVRVPLGDLPEGVTAVTVPVRREGKSHAPRNRSGQLRVDDVDLISSEPASAYSPAPGLNDRDLIFALEASRRDWSTVVDYFGPERAWRAALSLVRAGGVVLRCATDENLDLGLPVSWRRSHAWSVQHADLLQDLRQRPDPDGLRSELVRLMSLVPELEAERLLLEACAVGSPLRVPAESATATAAWSVYENAIRAAAVWWLHRATGQANLTAQDVAGRAFRNSKAWTPERAAAFANLVGVSFDLALDGADTEIRLRGPLQWWVGSVAADASVADPWLGLPAHGLHTVGDMRCSAQGVLIVENADTFERVAAIDGLLKTWLCIWGKGYTSHGMATLLKQFSRLPIAAWCDLDADGIKIIDVLETKLGRRLHPIGMDLELWETTEHRIQKPSQITRDKKLAAGLARRGPFGLRPLAEQIALYGGSCEQQPIHNAVLPTLLTQLSPLVAADNDA